MASGPRLVWLDRSAAAVPLASTMRQPPSVGCRLTGVRTV